MRILYLCPSPYLGTRDRAGWSTHMTRVIRELRDLGHDVRGYFAGGDARRQIRPLRGHPVASGTGLASLAAGGWRLAPAELRRARRDVSEWLHDRWLAPHVSRVCREFGAEVIYERTEVLHSTGARVARRLGLPLVLEVNGPLVDEREAWGGMLCPGWARRIEAGKYRAADAIVTVSEALAHYLERQGVDREKIHAIPNGADLSRFRPESAHAAAIRAKFGLGQRLVIGFVGAFADWHRLDTLIEAASRVAGTVDLHLLMIGDGPSRRSLRDQARQLGIEGRVTLPGSVSYDHVPHYLAAMDVCVLPSANWYMSPIKLFEYGAMGRPVIAPRTPAVQEVMRHGEEGWLIDPGCPSDLASAIRHLADHPDTRERLAATFQQRVREQYTWQQVAGRVSRLLEQSIEARLSATSAEPQTETGE